MLGFDDTLTFFVAVLLGIRHATDPDHLTAVSTVVLSRGNEGARRAGMLGVAWGVGHATTLLAVGIPLLLFVVIAVAVYVPALIRGERIAPGAPAVENQWLGGPRKTAGELAAPDTESSEAGGASGRW